MGWCLHRRFLRALTSVIWVRGKPFMVVVAIMKGGSQE